MSGQEENIFNINVYGENKEQIMNSTDSASEYIILLNEKLQYNVNTLISKTKEQENVITTHETELDKLETSITYMRGLLKNFVEIRKNEKEIVILTKSLEKNYIDHNNLVCKNVVKIKKDIILFIFVYLMMNMFMVTINILTLNNLIFNVIQLILIIPILKYSTKIEDVYNCICNPKTNNKHILDKIDKKSKSVSELDNAVDYLDEYIECL